MEEIDRKGTEKAIIRLNNESNELNDYFKSWEWPELNNVIYELEKIVESGIYRDLIDTARNFELSDAEITCMGKALQPPILHTALDNQGVLDVFKGIFTKNFNITDIFSIYKLIRLIYMLNVGGELDFKEEAQVYLGGLDERIIWALEDFDNVNVGDMPQWDVSYFKEMENIRWRDSESKILFEKLGEFLENRASKVSDFDWGYSFEYRTIQDSFFKLMVSCSAINQEKTFKDEEDIIKAYNVFLKLILADVSEYLAKDIVIGHIDSNNGYLACRNCGCSYQLQNGESPHDFVNQCGCGGRLEYKSEKGHIVPEDIFMALLFTFIGVSFLLSYSILKGFYGTGSDNQWGLLFILVWIILFLGIYFMIKLFLRLFNWEMGDVSEDPDNKLILVCKTCGKKYNFPLSVNIIDFPEKCSCGGKIQCLESVEGPGRVIDLKNNRRIVYFMSYAFSALILGFIFRILNLDMKLWAHGDNGMIILIVIMLFAVYMVTIIVRVLRRLGLKVMM